MKPIDTGLIEFKIPFSNGDVEVLAFNPNDSEFYGKIGELEPKMKEIYEDFEKVKDKGAKEIIDKMRNETNVKIKEAFDELFGDGASKVIFKYASPTSFVKNQYYPYYFLSEFMPEVVKVMKKNNESITKNAKIMLEHTEKYVKKNG